MGIDIPELFGLYNRKKKAELLREWGDKSKEEYAAFTETHAKASACVRCGQCETACPQHLEIVSLLKDVAEVFEG